MDWIIPGIIEGFRTLKDKTIKVIIETNELDPAKQQALFGSIQKFGYIAFKSDEFRSEEIEVLDGLKTDYEDTSKTPGQRLRGVLYILYKQDNSGYNTFTDYYNARMERFIDHLKSKIE